MKERIEISKVGNRPRRTRQQHERNPKMGEAKNRKNEIEALKAMGRRVANLTTPSTTHRNVNGFIVGNPYDIAMLTPSYMTSRMGGIGTLG